MEIPKTLSLIQATNGQLDKRRRSLLNIDLHLIQNRAVRRVFSLIDTRNLSSGEQFLVVNSIEVKLESTLNQQACLSVSCS